MHTKHLLLARITLQLLHQKWPMASMSWAGSLCWREAVARSAQARFLFWREVVVRSFSPGQISAGVEWWLVQPRSCPSAGTKQLLTWPRPGPSAGAKRSFVLSVQARQVTLPLRREGGHANSGCVARLPSAARLLCHSSAGCSLGPGHVALGALGKSLCKPLALLAKGMSLCQPEAGPGCSVGPEGQVALWAQKGRLLCCPGQIKLPCRASSSVIPGQIALLALQFALGWATEVPALG